MANEIDIRVDSNPSRQGIRRIEAALVAMGRTADRVGQQSDAAFTRLYEQIRLTAESAGDLRARIDALSGITTVLQRLGQSSGPSATLITSIRDLNKALAGSSNLDPRPLINAINALSATKAAGGSDLKELAIGVRAIRSAFNSSMDAKGVTAMIKAVTSLSAAAPSAAKVRNLVGMAQAMNSFSTFRFPQVATVTNFTNFVAGLKGLNADSVVHLGNLARVMNSFNPSSFRFSAGQAASLRALVGSIQNLNINTGTGAALQGLARVLQGLAAQANAATAAVNATNGAMNRGARDARLFGGQIGTLSSFVGRTEAAFQGFVAILGTNAILREIATLQKFESGLTAIGGASSFAAVEMRRANEIADRFGIALSAVSGGYSQMLAAANSSELLSLDESREIFEGVSQAVRVFGLSTEDAEGVYRALTQIISKGSLQMEELRGQLGDRLPGAVSIFAKGLGVTTSQLMDMTKAAEVTGETLKRGLLGFSGELKSITDAGMGEASKSVVAELGRLSTAFTNFAGMLGESGFSEAVINIAKGLQAVMGSGITEFLIGGLGGALSIVTSNMGALAGAVVLFGARILFAKQTANQFGLAMTGFGVAAIDARANLSALWASVVAGTARVTAGLAAMMAAGTGAWAAGIGAGLRGIAAAAGIALTGIRAFAVSLFSLAVTNPFTALAAAFLVIPPLIEMFARGSDNARISTDALNRASELQSSLLVDVSGGAKQAAAGYAKLTEQQRLQEKIKLDGQIDQLEIVRQKQVDIISGWESIADAQAKGDISNMSRAGSFNSKDEDAIAIANIRSKINKSLQDDGKLEVSLLKQVQSELQGVKEQYGNLTESGQKAFDETTSSISDLLEAATQTNELLKQLEGSGLDLTKLPPQLQGFVDIFGEIEESVEVTTTAVQELYSALERGPSLDDLRNQIKTVQDQIANKDYTGAAKTLRADEVRRLAGSEEFAKDNQEEINRLTTEQIAAAERERNSQRGHIRYMLDTADSPELRQTSAQLAKNIEDAVKMTLAETQIGLTDTLETLGDTVNDALNPKKSRSGLNEEEQKLKSAKSLLESLNQEYAAQRQLEDIQTAIGLLKVKDLKTLEAMGGEIALNNAATEAYEQTLADIAKKEADRKRDARQTAVFGSDTDQAVQSFLDGFTKLEGREQIIADYNTKLKELFVKLGLSPALFQAAADGAKLLNKNLSDFDADELDKKMKGVDSVLDRFNGQFDGNSRDAQRKDLTSQMDTIQKLIDGGALMGENMDKARKAVQLLGYELNQLTVIGDVFRVGLDSIESGLMNLAEELLQGEMDWKSWGRTIILELYRVMIVKPIVDWIASALSMGMSNFVPGGVSGLIGGGNKLPGSGANGLPAGRLGPAHTGGVIDEVLGMRSSRMHTGGMTKTMMERMSDVGSMIRGNEKLVNILAGSEVVKYGDKRNSKTPRPTIILKNEEILGPNHPLNVRNSSRRGSQGMFDKMHTGGVVGRAYGVSAQKAGGISPAPVVNAPSQHLQKPMAVTIVTNVNVTDNGGGKQASGGRGLDPQMMKEVARQLSDSQRSGILDVMNRRETGRSMKVNG